MPLLALAVGALAGGGTVWAISDTSKKIVLAGIVLGAGYYLYTKKA